MSKPVFTSLLNPPDDITDALNRGLDAYNHAVLGDYDYARLAITATDDDGNLIGGIYGDLLWDYFYIQTLWVDENHRGKAIGSQLIQRAETAAMEHGIFQAHVETITFQALPFYLKHGYAVFGELPNKPHGQTWYFLRKDLTPPDDV